MAQANTGDTVQVHYKGTLDDGSVFDSSESRDPLQFTIGEQQVIAGFESAVIGLNPGESKTVTMPSAEAYGPHHAELVMVVDRAELPEGLNPQPGQQLRMTLEEGGTASAIVTEATEKNITLDANHPLAGKDLTFEIQLVEIV